MGTSDPVQRPPLLALFALLLVAFAQLHLSHAQADHDGYDLADFEPRCSMYRDFTYIRHAMRCDIFYLCSDGVAHMMKCTPGLVFSNEVHRCVPHSEVSDECYRK